MTIEREGGGARNATELFRVKTQRKSMGTKSDINCKLNKDSFRVPGMIAGLHLGVCVSGGPQ